MLLFINMLLYILTVIAIQLFSSYIVEFWYAYEQRGLDASIDNFKASLTDKQQHSIFNLKYHLFELTDIYDSATYNLFRLHFFHEYGNDHMIQTNAIHTSYI